MIEYSGKRVTTARDAVTGKLLTAKSLYSNQSDSAAILMWDGCCELSTELLDRSVGIVLPEFLEPDKKRFAAHLAEFCHLPAICLSSSPPFGESSSHYDIAILAPIQGKLFVNPDIETVSSYLCAQPHGACKRLSILTTDSDMQDCCDGIVIGKNLERFNDEESLYEHLCEIADKNTGVKLVTEIPLGENTEAFSSRVSALYRAGVWGRFSLLCTDIKTPKRVADCISIIQSVFCRLDSSDREFNGFMPKGISVDTPILLLNPPHSRTLDFFCLDVPSLCKSFSGGISRDPLLIEEYMLEFKKKANFTEISLKLNGHSSSEFIERISPKEIYTESRIATEFF